MDACTATSASRPASCLKRIPSFSLIAPAGLHCACPSKQRSKTWKASHASLGRSSSAGGLSKNNEQEGNVLEDVATLLGSCEQLKAMVDSSSSSGVGPDMRNRVDHLLKRVRMLKQSVDRAAHVAGGRLPSQLIGSLKALQREHGSVENIVRLATQAGPVFIEQESSSEENSGLAIAAQEGNSSLIYEADTVDVELAQGQENETPVEVLSGPKYVMSTPFSEGSFKLTAVRAEIERRVMEQLLKKQRQSISDLKQDFTKERKSKSTEFQKVSSVKQRSLADKSDVDDAIQTGKNFRPLMVDAQQVYYSTESDNQKTELETRRGEEESGKTISLELHEQMSRNFEDALSDVRHQLSDVTHDLKEREDNLQALKKNLMDKQSELLEKINELSEEVTKRLTAEQLSNTLGKVIFDMEADLKRIQSQLVALGSDVNMKDKIMAGWQGEHERSRQELQAGILRLEGRLHQRESMLEGFNPQSVLAELGTVKATLIALQEGRLSEESQMADWRTTLEHFERSLLGNAQQIRKLTSEVECRVREGEVKDELKKVLEEVEKQSKKWQEHIDCIGAEQARSAANLGLLQEEWKSQRKELYTQIEDVKGKLIFLEPTQNQGALKEELLHIKDKLNELQEAEKHGKSLDSEAQQQMMDLEAKGMFLQEEWKAYRKELQTQIEDVRGKLTFWETTGILTELSHIKDKLSELQEEQKHGKSLVSEAQQQMMGLEGKKSELQEEWKSHRKDLQIQIEVVKDKLMLLETTQNQGVLKELSNFKDRLCELQEEQKHDRSILLEAHEQMVVSEGKGLDLQEEWNSYRRDLQTQIKDMKEKLVILERTQTQAVLTELSHIKDKLGVLQEQQKHAKSLVLEAQQQMVLLEGKGSDLLKRMSENAEAQKQDLWEEVRTLVNELLRNQRGSMQESLAIRQPQASAKDVAPHAGNLVNSPSTYELSSELSDAVSADDQPEATTYEGAQQVSDKERASLEAFFSVMGQLIREELKKMDHTSAQILPSADLRESGESTQPLTSSGSDKPIYPETDGESQRQFIILQYDSSWKRAFIHYCADNAGWTEVPGVPMQKASNSGGKSWKEFRIQAGRLEFVVTDGQGNWDRAPNGHNYLLEKPGIFELGAGVLKAVLTR